MDGRQTEVRALEAELISRFADDVAHEIRNPLNALVINIEVLRRRVAAGDAEGAAGRIDVIAEEVGRVHASIERFIALLRPLRVADNRTDLADAFDDVLPLLRLRAGALRAGLDGPGEFEAHVALPRDRVRFALLDAGMAGFERAGPDGHLSCTVEGDDQFWRVHWAARTGEAAGEPDLRLARAIVADAGGEADVRTTAGNGFEIVLTLPRIA